MLKVIKEMQVKSTMGHHNIPLKCLKLKKLYQMLVKTNYSHILLIRI